MRRPKHLTAEFATKNFLIYQNAVDNHRFFNKQNKNELQLEADYWRKTYEDLEDDDAAIIELGLTKQVNPD